MFISTRKLQKRIEELERQVSILNDTRQKGLCEEGKHLPPELVANPYSSAKPFARCPACWKNLSQ